MKRKLTFRYGLDLTARIGLLVWSSGWLVILGYMVDSEKVRKVLTGFVRLSAGGFRWRRSVLRLLGRAGSTGSVSGI